MLKSKTGSSTNADAKAAGREAAQAAKVDDPKILFAYSSVDYDMGQMLAGLREGMPSVPIIGNTSFTGVIVPGAGFVSGDNGFLGVMAMGGDNLNIGVAGFKKTNTARETGNHVAREAMSAAGKSTPPDFFYMVASSGEEEYYLKGISEVIGRVPCFGGTAADNSIEGKWSLYTDQGAFSEGVAVAFFYTDMDITNEFTGAYEETNDFGVITEVRGNRTLVSIDGEPALKKYAKWIGEDPANLLGNDLLSASIAKPLGVKDRIGDLVAIRHPMVGNEDYSMNLGSNVTEKTAVIRMEASTDELVGAASSTLQDLIKKMPGKPKAFHLVHCGGRRAGIGARITEEVEAIAKAAGDVPFIVEFTFGEYGFVDDDRNAMGGLMLSYTGFSE